LQCCNSLLFWLLGVTSTYVKWKIQIARGKYRSVYRYTNHDISWDIGSLQIYLILVKFSSMPVSCYHQVKIGESNHLLVYKLRLLPCMTAIIECNVYLIRNVCREFAVNGEKLWMYKSGKHLSTIYLYNKQNVFWNSQYAHLFGVFFPSQIWYSII